MSKQMTRKKLQFSIVETKTTKWREKNIVELHSLSWQGIQETIILIFKQKANPPYFTWIHFQPEHVYQK